VGRAISSSSLALSSAGVMFRLNSPARVGVAEGTEGGSPPGPLGRGVAIAAGRPDGATLPRFAENEKGP
jgi:hypothetical protein